MKNLKQNSIWPMNDVIEGDWNKKYRIKSDYPFFFKLNDNRGLISYIQYSLNSNDELKQRVQFFQDQLNDYRKVKVWLRNEEKTFKFTLYDIYSNFLNHLRYGSYEDQLFRPQSVSLLGPLGPFTHMSLVDCLNDDLINKFIFNSVLRSRLPSRKMRIYTEGSVRIDFGKDFKRKSSLALRQFTDIGLLLSSTDESVLTHMEDGDFVKVYLGGEIIQSFLENKSQNTSILEFSNINEPSYFFIEEQKIVKSLSYKSNHTNEIFLFIRYNDIKDNGIGKLFAEFIAQVKGDIEGLMSA